MELFSNIAYSFIARNEPSYSDINDNINKLIEDLGEKMQKDLVTLQQKILLGFKDKLLSAQQQYRQLQKSRNEEMIKQNVLVLKSQQQKLFSQEEVKSLEMNKLYDQIKVELKRNMEYEHQLQLEIKFLTKQLAIAKKKAELLDLEINDLEQPHLIASSQPQHQTCYLPKIIKTKPLIQTTQSDQSDKMAQRILKNKIQTMNQYLELLSQQEPIIQQIVGKLDVGSCHSELQKEQMVDRLFRQKDFKQYLYNVMFRRKKQQPGK